MPAASEPIADLSTGDPYPMATAADAAGRKPRPMTLRAALAALPPRADAFLGRLHKCLSTPAGIDTTLLLVCYTARFSATALERLSQSVLRRSDWREWIAVVVEVAAPRARAVVVGPAASKSMGVKPVAAAAALVLSRRLKALSALLSEARMMMRLWGLLGMYFWGRGLVGKTLARRRQRQNEDEGVVVDDDDDDGVATDRMMDDVVAWAQLGACVVFQGLENGAYLSGKGVLGWSAAAQATAYKWSARFWALYVGLELGRLAGEGMRAKAGGEKAVEREDSTRAWRNQVVRNLAWAPLTVHWSMEKGFVSEMMVGLLGSIPGIIQMRDLWRETA